MEKLRIEKVEYHRVEKGQTLKEIATAFSVSERAIVAENGLTCAPKFGQIIKIPDKKGNAYTVKIGEDKTLLCGSEESYEKKNGTKILYPGMRVIL